MSDYPTGYIYDWRKTEEVVSSLMRPSFSASGVILRESGKDKIALLYKALEKVNNGNYPIRRQEIGDCVAHAGAGAQDVVSAVEIIIKGEWEQWLSEYASEVLYGFMRVEYGGRELGREDGAFGAWLAASLEKFGNVRRDVYGNIDLTNYSGQRAREWGYRGVPDQLEPEAMEHTVQSVSLVTSYEEARDAIANGFPVVVCSMQGFTSDRDRYGFAKPSGTWAHAMLFHGVDDAFKRPGLCCQNSWGPDWNTGPKRHDQPDGSFWVDADVADKMLRKNPDSYVVSGQNGYPIRDFDFHSAWMAFD